MDTKRIAIAELKKHRDKAQAEADSLSSVIAKLEGAGAVKVRASSGAPRKQRADKGVPRGPMNARTVARAGDTEPAEPREHRPRLPVGPGPGRAKAAAQAGQGASLVDA